MRVNLSTHDLHLARTTRSPARVVMLRRMSAMKAASPVRSLDDDDPLLDDVCTRLA
jgi:hypothetical protein